MNKGLFQKLLPHLIAVVVFLIVALFYCKPALQGDVLQQHDVLQWNAMSKNSFDYKETHGKFPLWTTSMFSGMPAYQIAMEADKSVISPGIFYSILSLGLPKPMHFFFLACICFYFLSQVLRTNSYIGIFGALAFAYATYNPIIIAAGHDTKMQSIAFMPALIGSLILVYERKYIWGAALTGLSTFLLIGSGHPQIAYYTFLITAFMTIGYAINWIKKSEWKHLAIALAIAIGCGILGVLGNALTLFTTAEYSKATIRGGSELADSTSNRTTTGLSESYAFDYSMYKTEPFVMMVPNMFGGSSEAIEQKLEESKAMENLQSMPPELANQIAGARTAYWGGIGFTSGPPYAGAIICFLALLGFAVLDSKHKWWILAITILTILMSWGGYFEGFNSLLLKALPLYNKFRAPSMIIVVPTFLFCMMAIMTLQKLTLHNDTKDLWGRYKKGLLVPAAVFVVLLLIYFTADYTSKGDTEMLTQIAAAPEQVKEYVRGFLNALKEDRQSLFFSSLLRSLLFAALAAFVLWLAVKNKMKGYLAFTIIGILAFIDVMAVNVKYLNSENYQDSGEYEASFTPSAVDQQIMQDKSYYRVFDVRQGLSVALGMQGALPSYFHNSIGGYHAAKLSIYQDLIENQLYNFPNCLPVINMLNTKYIIQRDEAGKEGVIPNPEALGAAWFVKAVRFENTPRAAMNALSTFNPRDTAIVYADAKTLVSYDANSTDSAATIQLIKNDNDVVTYTSNATSNRFAVFSEVYYEKGWKAYIDGKETPIVRTNYVLRGLSIPAGKHEIKFEFKPQSYYSGDTIAMIVNIILFLLIGFAIFTSVQQARRK